MKVKKQTDKELLLSWGITNPHMRIKQLRYKNPVEKGIYWYWFGRHVRERDVKKYGVCVSCGKPITFETCDPGHFMPAVDCGRDLLFDEQNVNAECKQCNAWDDTHLLGYAEGLDKRYGEGTALRLRQRRDEYKAGPVLKDFKGHQYAEMIERLPNYQQAKLQNEESVVE